MLLQTTGSTGPGAHTRRVCCCARRWVKRCGPPPKLLRDSSARDIESGRGDDLPPANGASPSPAFSGARSDAMTRVAIADYGLCNLDSVRRAVEECGARAFVTDQPADLDAADKIILPGVGAFP